MPRPTRCTERCKRKGSTIERKSLPATLDSLSDLRRFAADAAAAAGIDEERTYKLQLAVDEIATNIVVHGYKQPQPDESLVITSEVADGELRVSLEDGAPEFDPRSRAAPEQACLAMPLEERQIGGLGIYLAISGVDRFDYRYEGGRNINVFALKAAAK